MSAEGMPPLPEPRGLYTEPPTYTAKEMLTYGRLVARECMKIAHEVGGLGGQFSAQDIRKRFKLEQEP